MARTRPDILKVVLGPYVQYCPCEASEQKPESELKVIELRGRLQRTSGKWGGGWF